MSVRLDAATDRVYWGDISALAGLTSFSVAITIRPDSPLAGSRFLIGQWSDTQSNQAIFLYHDSANLAAAVYYNGGWYSFRTSTNPLGSGGTVLRIVWRVWDLNGAKGMDFWVNGTQMTSLVDLSFNPSACVQVNNSPVAVAVGYEPNTTDAGPLYGDYKEVAIWGSKIPDADCQDYGAGVPPSDLSETGRILYCPLSGTDDIDDLWGSLTGTNSGGTDAAEVTPAAAAAAAVARRSISIDIAPHNMTALDAPTPYVASASSTYDPGNGAYKAFDKLIGFIRYWLANAATGWLKIDLGANYAVAKYRIAANTIPEPNRCPKDWTFEGSANGTNFDVLDTRTNSTGWASGETREFVVSSPAAYRYYRLNVSANNGDGSYLQVAELYLFVVTGETAEPLVVTPAAAAAGTGASAGVAVGHRYWRLVILGNTQGGVIRAGEIEFHTSVGGSDVTGSGTASASTAHGSFPAANAFDNNVSTHWAQSVAAQGAWVAYDFGAGNAFNIVEFKYTGPSDYNYCTMGNTDLQYSDDGSTWVIAYHFRGKTPLTGLGQTIEYDSSEATPEFDAAPHWLATSSDFPFTASASTEFGSGYFAWSAFDEVGAASSWNTTAGNTTGWLKLDLGAAYSEHITTYAVRAGDWVARSPHDWTLQGSNNDTDWNTLDTVTGETGWAQNEKRTFTVDTPGSYRYYKLVVTANDGDGTYLNIREFYLGAGEPAENVVVTPAVAAAGTHAQATARLGSITLTPAAAIAGTAASASTFYDAAPHGLNTNNSPPYLVSASSEFSTWYAYHAFDGVLAVFGYWLSVGPTGWLKLDLGTGNGERVSSYAVRVNTIPEPNRAPKDWTLQGSNDNSQWTTLDTQTNQTSWASGEKRTFEIAEPETYRYYKLDITANNSDGSYTQVGELYLLVADEADLEVTPAAAIAGTAASLASLPLEVEPAAAAAGTFASAALFLPLELTPAVAAAGTHATFNAPIIPAVAAAGTAADRALLLPLEVVPAVADARAAAGSPAVYPLLVTAIASAGTAASATVSGGLEELVVLPAPAAAGVYAEMSGLRIETYGTTAVWFVFPAPAGCAAAAPDPPAWGRTYRNLVTFPALQASTPNGAMVVGWAGFGWLDIARGGLTLEGELSVMGSGGGAVAFPLARATGALLYGGLGGSGILVIAPPMTASGGDSPLSGTAAVPLPFPVAAGVGLTGIVLTGSIEIRAPDAAGLLASDQDNAGAVALPSLALAGTMATGMSPVDAAIALPALHAAGQLLPERAGLGTLLLPALALTATGFSTATTLAGVLVLRPLDLLGEMATPAAPDFAALGVYVSAMNLRAEAVSDYERFPFNSYCRIHDHGYAAKDDGIWELEGEKDDTFDIFAEIHKMSFDLASFHHKRMTDAFFHLHSNGPYRIDIYADGVRSGRDVDDPGGGIHAWKVALPRGLKGQGLGIRVTNTGGSYILLDEVEMVSEFTSRRNR